uniref:OBP34 n=1 Tax=Eupeodes corollae TaxID=290404 RepID=A0A8F9RZH4_9MUSC|nr:OBP34 [Eupeodes corollae]
MKTFVIALIVLMIQEIIAGPEDVICRQKIGITFEESSDFLQRAKIPEIRDQMDQKYKCFVLCLMEEMNILDGCSYQLELGKQRVSEMGLAKLIPILDSCKDSSVGSEPCDCGYNVFKCVLDGMMAMEEQ